MLCSAAGKLLAYNCSPSFNWKRHLDDATIAKFQQEIGKMGYKFQFVTLAGFHSLNHAMFELSAGYAKRGMAAYSELQQLEFASEAKGYTCSKHQREVCACCGRTACMVCAFLCFVEHHLSVTVAGQFGIPLLI